MKKTITKPDGSVEVVEGTPEEISAYEQALQGDGPKNETLKKGPKLLTDNMGIVPVPGSF